MKILWFTNTPSLAETYLNSPSYGGAWIKLLHKEIINIPGIELAVCFVYNKQAEPFYYNNTKFYPISLAKENRFQKYIQRMKGNYEKDALLNNYLSIVNEFRPDIIHIHGTENNYGLIQDLVNIPCIISVQGILTVYLRKYFSGIPRNLVSKHDRLLDQINFNGFLNNYRSIKKKAKREITILSRARYVFGRTDWDKYITSILAPQAKYYGMDTRIVREVFFNNCWQKRRQHKLRLFTTSNSHLYKGLEMVYQTSALLKEYCDFEFEWVVAGIDKGNKIIHLLNKLYHTRPEEINLYLPGRQMENELLKYMLEADIYIQVSHIENSPNSLAEALIMGMPVIASHAGGTGTYINNLYNGLLIQDGDPYVLAGAIKTLYQDADLAYRLASNARIDAIKRHNRQEIVKNIINVYRSIISVNFPHSYEQIEK
ncbi:MAG: glycosyltransferase family 4 protein [Bacteroidales bacterium]|nr:glycosyltransferase family 4 protein [Bacteroidales bacterium]